MKRKEKMEDKESGSLKKMKYYKEYNKFQSEIFQFEGIGKKKGVN